MAQTRWMTVADPIHGNIRFDRQDPGHRLVLNVMNCRAFQRLRRIKQMGMAEFVFPGATHSRFVHSIGATHLMVQALEHLNHTHHSQKILASPYPGTSIPLSHLLLLGILVHDIGHTPLSHTLEDILDLKDYGLLHDDYWNEKIFREDEELHNTLIEYDPQLPDALLHFMGQGAEKHYLAQLISSQLDMDRLDYLQRDSHYLGVQYGRIEADRLIANLELTQLASGEPIVAMREEATPAIEHYLFGRHQAYKMALHSLDKASESLLKKTLRRFQYACEHGFMDMFPTDRSYELFLLMSDGKRLTTSQFLRMDDCYLWDIIHSWTHNTSDLLLRALAIRLMRHELFKFIDLCKYGITEPLETVTPVYEALKNYYHQRGLSFEFGFDETWVKPKALYQKPPVKEPIWIKTSQGVIDLEEASSLPLVASDPTRGEKHLVFVWDRETRYFLVQTLDQHFGKKPMLFKR
jgi:HD superfamily phosphohydrolase